MVGNREKCALIKVNAGNLWICGKPGCAPRNTLMYKHGQVIMTLRMCIVHRVCRLLVIPTDTFFHYRLCGKKETHVPGMTSKVHKHACVYIFLSLKIIANLVDYFLVIYVHQFFFCLWKPLIFMQKCNHFIR